MMYYADYEALEFNSFAAVAEGIYPYYLNPEQEEKTVCPIFLSIANEYGKIIINQNPYYKRVSILDAFDKMMKYNRKDKTITISFHFLRYDARILIHELFFNKFVNILDSEKLIYHGDYSTDKNQNAFAIVGKNLSQYIGLNIYYKGYTFFIRDTYSILSSPQDEILESFGYPLKVKVNWKTINLRNLRSNMTLIKDRCNYDVQSLAKSIEGFKNMFEKEYGGTGLTAAGMALSAYKKYLYKKMSVDKKKDPTVKEIEDVFRSIYPIIDDEFSTKISEYSYHGGITTNNPIHQGKKKRNLQCVDINSSYPSSMVKQLPYGLPIKIDNFTDEGYSEYIVKIHFKFKKRSIPFQRCHRENKCRALLKEFLLPLDQTYTRTQFPYEFNGYIAINSIDLRTLKKYAKIKYISFERGYNYKTTDIMADFIIHIYEKRQKLKELNKEREEKGEKKDLVMDLVYKLLLNSLYGKFAQDLKGYVQVYEDLENYTKVDVEDPNLIYRPLSSCITAYSRENWINVCYLLGDNFVYGDTDSVFFVNVDYCITLLKEHDLLHSSILGKWSIEYKGGIKHGKFLSKKNYLIEILGNNKKSNTYGEWKLKLKCVGLNKDYHKQINFNNFILDSIPFEVEKMVNVYGGKAKRPSKFKIRERLYF